MKLTKWFPNNIRPIHAGTYEVASIFKGKYYAYWNGRQWSISFRMKANAEEFKDQCAMTQAKIWRGILKD